jgi:L-lysine exporter family protein LysE/ArgO
MIFFLGLSMGLAYAAPIGLQNLFVINSAISHPFKRALLSALIVVFFDISLAMACFFGIGLLIQQISWLEMFILFAGSLIVIWIGLNLLRSRPELKTASAGPFSLWRVITTAWVVTWFNPQAIIDGTMMLGAFRAALPGAEGYLFICGVAAASLLWFTGITYFISFFRNKLTNRVLRIINLICGAVVLFYGGKLFITFIQQVQQLWK